MCLVGVKILLGIPHMSDKFHQSSFNPLIRTIFCWVAICIRMGTCHENFGKTLKQFHFIDRIMIVWIKKNKNLWKLAAMSTSLLTSSSIFRSNLSLRLKVNKYLHQMQAGHNNHERIVTRSIIIEIIMIVWNKIGQHL